MAIVKAMYFMDKDCFDNNKKIENKLSLPMVHLIFEDNLVL